MEIRLKSFKEVKIINRFNGGEELFNFYYIDLEEFFEKSIKIRTQIKMVKKYRDFLDFNHIINNLHLNFGQPIINLPDSIKSNEENDYEFIKEKWSHYFKEIAMSPRVEENESFKEFFCLNRLGDNFQYHRNKVESLDFTH